MTVKAAIDCGTNATRLLISDRGRDVVRRHVITGLGRGVDATGRLSAEGIARTIEVLREYRELLDGAGVTTSSDLRAIATSAARDAANRDDFFGPAGEVLGVELELLSGDDEGRLAFSGATAELDPSLGPFLVVDVGGGSTEFIVGGAEVTGVLSVDVGSVRLTEQWLHHDPPTAEELSQAISVVHAHLDDVTREIPEVVDVARLVGVAGTVTTVAAVEIGLPVYDRDRVHHFVLTRAAAEDVFRTLATEKLADRVFNPGLEAERADVIVAGAAVLATVMRHWGFEECLVSDADILDGLIASIGQ